jgi:hypothetical protein
VEIELTMQLMEQMVIDNTNKAKAMQCLNNRNKQVLIITTKHIIRTL